MKSRLALNIGCSKCSVRHLCLASNLEDKDILELNNLITLVKCLAKNEHLSTMNTPLQNLYAVYKGSCKEYWINEKGDECITNFYFPGDIIGIESVEGRKHLFSVSALEETRLCVIPIERFLELLNNNPTILRRFLSINSLKMQNDQSLKMSITANEKISDFLLHIYHRMLERHPDSKEVRLAMSQLDISNYLGIAYETVNRIFSHLKRKRIISLKNKILKIHDQNALEESGRLDYPKL